MGVSNEFIVYECHIYEGTSEGDFKDIIALN